ncbi:diaminopimelate decarboxylase [Pseudomonas lalucatii]|uniref:Diaminopimelate decarboxylase n=1 Tax=Pseudomonas lalucatii TaxID=1424203 RepID=A0ABS5Q4M3_9PSED|nr:diaminopimelate decarboxylase [Pseudomonas lalucatii]MBS7663711.1 diaminopimelate decarboxylase [Pseudomonas lalucatii]MBS7725179.1 diaminopimelate decarboxylase [Pseudomonas lalucatii]QVM86865.1 diaminopimelate decarboxylase [Pseudomonas lalucatii]
MSQVVSLHPWKRPQHLDSANNQLLIDGVNAIDLVERYGSPLFVYSAAKLRDNARDILNNFRRVHGRTRVCFASKACANLAVLKLFKDCGLDLEVNSGGEFYKAQLAGFAPAQMVFNGVAKQVGELREVIGAGIKAINVDSLSELARILAVAGELGRQARVSLRIIPEIQGGAAAGWQTGTSTSKFGMTAAEQVEAIELILAQPGALKLVGVHAHIGTQITDIGVYQAEANFLIDYVRQVAERLPYPLEHVNLGGGFPKNYSSAEENFASVAPHYCANYRTEIDFARLAEHLIKPMAQALGEQIELIVEPGRSMVSDGAILLSRIEAHKERQGRPVFYLDAGYSVLFDLYNGWYFHMLNASRADDHDTRHCRMAGPLCDSSDTYYDIEGEGAVADLIAEEPRLAEHRAVLERVLVHQPNLRELPAATAMGDVIALLDVGAYALEMMSQYCGRQSAAAVLVDLRQGSRLIRRRGEYRDLLAHDLD